MRTLSLFIGIIWLAISGIACKDASTSDPTTNTSEWTCGSYKGHTLYTGPKGGCYYYNSSGDKTYVDKSNCNC